MKLNHVNYRDCHAALLASSPSGGPGEKERKPRCPSRWNRDKRGTAIGTGTPTSTAA